MRFVSSHAAPHVGRDVGGGARRTDPRSVDGDIDLPIEAHRLVESVVYVIGGADVRADERGLPAPVAYRVQRRLPRFRRPRQTDDARALCREEHRDSLPDAGAEAGYHCHLAVDAVVVTHYDLA